MESSMSEPEESATYTRPLEDVEDDGIGDTDQELGEDPVTASFLESASVGLVDQIVLILDSYDLPQRTVDDAFLIASESGHLKVRGRICGWGTHLSTPRYYCFSRIEYQVFCAPIPAANQLSPSLRATVTSM